MLLRLKQKIRNLISENIQDIKVLKAKQTGLDHLNRFKINLSDGSVDYIDKKYAVITNSQQADYKCANIKGVVKSESNLTYEFIGVNCDGYIWIDENSFKLIS